MVERITISRRGLVQTAGVALGAGVAGIPASALASSPLAPDMALVALITRHADALAELDALDAAADPFREQFRAGAPEKPEALRWRPGDFPRTTYGQGLSDGDPDTDERGYFGRGVEWLRKARPVAQWSEEHEARRREIIESWDAWMTERRAMADRIGLTAANDACDRASDLIEEVENAIMDHVPVTLAGFRAKAQWIASTRNGAWS